VEFKISSMLNPNVYDHTVAEMELIEIYISSVVLTGDFGFCTSHVGKKVRA
jgi:aminoglycoside phosphotransferase family enzyme